MAIATLTTAGLIALSPTLTWFAWANASREPGTGSGLDLYRHRDDLRVSGNPLMGAFDGDGWYESFYGPAVPILLGTAIAVVGIAIAFGRARRTTVVTGLWLALVSWLAAGETGASGSYFLGGLGGSGIRMWAGASVGAVGIMAWTLTRSPPRLGHRGAGWFAVLSVVAWVPMSLVVYDLEDAFPFAAVPVLIASVVAIGLPSSGAILAFEILRARPRRPVRSVPAVLALLLCLVLFGGSLLGAWRY